MPRNWEAEMSQLTISVATVLQKAADQHQLTYTLKHSDGFENWVLVEWVNKNGVRCQVSATLGFSHELPVAHIMSLEMFAWFTDAQGEATSRKPERRSGYYTDADAAFDNISMMLETADAFTKEEVIAHQSPRIDTKAILSLFSTVPDED